MTLDGKTAAITGAGSGMGRATAELFAQRGARVVVVDLDTEAALETVDRIETAGGEATAAEADVSVAEDVQGFVDRTVEEYGRINVLHNNAGIPQRSTPVEDVTDTDYCSDLPVIASAGSTMTGKRRH